MNKSELVDNISETAHLSKADAERALNALLDAVQGAVASGDKVTLPGFGSFSRSQRSARTGRNPSARTICQSTAQRSGDVRQKCRTVQFPRGLSRCPLSRIRVLRRVLPAAGEDCLNHG